MCVGGCRDRSPFWELLCKEGRQRPTTSAMEQIKASVSPSNILQLVSVPSKTKKWLWEVGHCGGYFVSDWLFNVADQLNQCILLSPAGLKES
jgi:hypothetical protein